MIIGFVVIADSGLESAFFWVHPQAQALDFYHLGRSWVQTPGIVPITKEDCFFKIPESEMIEEDTSAFELIYN